MLTQNAHYQHSSTEISIFPAIPKRTLPHKVQLSPHCSIILPSFSPLVITDLCSPLVHSINGATILNVSKCYHYSKDNCSRDSQWYSAGLRAGWSGVRVPAGAGNFPLHHRVQTGSGAHPASYPMGNRGSIPGDKATGAWSLPLTSI
jgi:hypothetical protein